MIKYCIFFALASTFLWANEPSAFEKQSGATKHDLKNLQNLVSQMRQKLANVEQSQEGISSLYESQSTKLQQAIIEGAQHTKDIEGLKVQIELLNSLNQQVNANAKNIQTLQAQLKNINDNLAALNQNIINELKELNNIPSKTQSSQKNKNPTTNSSFNKDKSKKAEIFTQAQDFFQKKEYQAAKVRLEWLLEINYKEAHSNFYLGEIAFAKKSYNNAIKHYRASVLANDTASYIPTLLLHTAQSFNAIKDTESYNKFLDSLINSYPSSKEAQEAKKLKNQNKEKK